MTDMVLAYIYVNKCMNPCCYEYTFVKTTTKQTKQIPVTLTSEIKWSDRAHTVGPALQSMFCQSLMLGVFLRERSRVLFTAVILLSGDRQKSRGGVRTPPWRLENQTLGSQAIYIKQSVIFLRRGKPKTHARELLTLAPRQNDFFSYRKTDRP